MNYDTDRFTLDAAALANMRSDFNAMLIHTVKGMMDKSSNTATLTLKLDIELQRTTVIDKTALDGVRDVIMPRFAHKVSSVMQTKLEEKGHAEGAYELTYDTQRCEYIMRPVANEQTTFEQYGG